MNQADLSLFVNIFIKFFFLLTPFFALWMFLTLTQGESPERKRHVALRVMWAVLTACFTIFFFGKWVFSLLGITLDAFRIGAGTLLFLTAVELVRGPPVAAKREETGDVAVVPIAIPVIIGPAVTGTLLVMAADLVTWKEKAIGFAALCVASAAVGAILYTADAIERWMGRERLTIAMKLTGLILAAISAEIVFTGIRNFLQRN